MIEVRAYDAGLRNAWNAFNASARNGHFLFDRGFMEYHADRFDDASLMVFEDGRLLALMPASREGGTIGSHPGLTFGGLVIDEASTAQVLAILDACAAFWRQAGADRLTYKALPWIYHSQPAQADLYWLFRRDAALIRRDVTAAIDYRARGRPSGRRSRGARKAVQGGFGMARSHDWGAFWRLLEEVLASRHGAAPVHSLAEIEALARRFPDQIALHVAERDGAIEAGVVMFVTPLVAHAQYIAVGEAGRAGGALDGLFEHLIGAFAASHRYFDFGISNTDGGRTLNEGLIRQKEEFGASAVVHDTYRVVL